MNKAVFFDRDGTINVERHYVYQIESFEIFPDVPKILSELRRRGYLLILITNQSGIARGYFTVRQMQELHQYMQNELSRWDAQFDDILYCPHYPKGIIPKYAVDCNCRKPGSMLFEQAVKKYGIQPEVSVAVGDKDRDLIPAKKLGMKCIKISGEKSGKWIICPEIKDLMKYI